MMTGIVAVLVAALNLICFALMGYDKDCARKGKRRVPEKQLFLSAACFGAVGGVLGMQLFRHKTKHWTFSIFFPMLAAAQIALLAAGFIMLNR